MTDPHGRPTTAEPAAQVDAWLAEFEDALTARDVDRAAAMFGTDGLWRDLVAFTWNITTVEGPDGVRELLRATLDTTAPRGFTATEVPTEAGGTTTALIEFETAVGRGRGVLRLRNGRAFTLLTALHELTGHEEPTSERRPMGAEHGVLPGRRTWLERRQAETEELGRTTQPYVVVVGGGQGGIALGARLRQLDVPHLVIDRHPRPGDQWRSRYKSLCLHDPVWIDHLPYLEFPANWPVFSPKDKIARLAGDVRPRHGGQLLGLDHLPAGELRRGGRHLGGRRRAGRRGAHPATRAPGAGHRHVGEAEPARLPRHGPVRGRAAPLVANTRGRTPTAAGRPSSSAPTTPPTTSPPRCGRAART